MPQSDPPSLRAIQLFKDVDEATIGELDRQCRWRRCGAGEQIVDHLDESRDVYFVASGVAEVVVYSSSGRYISFDDLTAGSSFGAIAAIDGMPRSASVVASTEALIGSMPPEAFAKVLMSHPTVAMNLIREMTRIIRMDNDRIVEMSTQGATYRVQAELNAFPAALADGNREPGQHDPRDGGAGARRPDPPGSAQEGAADALHQRRAPAGGAGRGKPRSLRLTTARPRGAPWSLLCRLCAPRNSRTIWP